MNRAYRIGKELMYENDLFSKWLGITIIEIREGTCKLAMTIRDEMTNGFNIAHGGITYSLADSALAFASNSHGRQAVSIETAISHIKSLKSGDTILAEAIEESCSEKLAIYQVKITRGTDLVAHFKGTVYRTSRDWKE